MRVESKPYIVAILCSDVHLSHRAPLARSAEPDWYAAMARPLVQLAALSQQHQAPVAIAGDLFHRWDSCPELINFALRKLTFPIVAVPGQHDLPYHSYEDRHRSAYWTLVRAGAIANVAPGEHTTLNNVRFYGYGWGANLIAAPKRSPLDRLLCVAVCHRYVWVKGCGHPQAKDEQRLSRLADALRGYDAAVFGDNHKGFFAETLHGCSVINAGALIRRNADERDYRPRVGLLMTDGSVSPHYLDCSEDVWLDAVTDQVSEGADPERYAAFIEGLSELQDSALDFGAALRRFAEAHKADALVRNILLAALERSEDKP